LLPEINVVEIKTASTPEKSQSLRGLHISDAVQYGLIALAGVTWAAYNYLPQQYKEEFTRFIQLSLFGGAVASRILNKSVRAGRLEIGDLESTISNYVLLETPEMVTRLESVKEYIETGRVPSAAMIHKFLREQTNEKVSTKN
jgi:hypothetical protein